MLSVGGTIGLMLLLVLVGKSRREIRLSSFVLLVFIAAIQVAIVLFTMYTMTPPSR